jgi:hypothetical protein
VRDPVEDRAVHEPQPCRHRGAAPRGGLAGKRVEDPLRGGAADGLHQVAHLGRRAAHQVRVGVAALIDPAEEGVELLGRRRVGVDDAHQLGRPLRQHGAEVGLLAREVVVQQRLRHARGAGDAGHRQLVVAVAGEQVGAALEQPPAACVDVEAVVGGLAHGGQTIS